MTPDPARPTEAGPADLERARQMMIETAIAAYEDAGLRGLCAEGRWECALEAIRRLDLRPPSAAPER